MREKFKRVGATWSWTWNVLGILLGAATVISLVKNGFAIELRGLPLTIYQQYVWFRDTLFEPVVWVLRYYGLALPWWLKDLMVGYALVATSHLKTSKSLLARELRATRWPLRQRARLVWQALCWPVNLGTITLVSSAERGTVLHSKHFKARDMMQRLHGQAIGILSIQRGRFHQLILLNLLITVACAASFFLWNYIQNVAGPPG